MTARKVLAKPQHGSLDDVERYRSISDTLKNKDVRYCDLIPCLDGYTKYVWVGDEKKWYRFKHSTKCHLCGKYSEWDTLYYACYLCRSETCYDCSMKIVEVENYGIDEEKDDGYIIIKTCYHKFTCLCKDHKLRHTTKKEYIVNVIKDTCKYCQVEIFDYCRVDDEIGICSACKLKCDL